MKQQAAELTVAEVVAGLFVALPAMLVLTAYLVDSVGLPLDPLAMLALLLLEVAGVGVWIWRGRHRPRILLDGWGLLGFALVTGGFLTYILWLAIPSLLPVNQAPDMVSHVNLINFIQQRHSLVHDLWLDKYLGEQVSYTPGSHILAALVADWAGTSGLRVLHPILAVLVAMKVGIIYNCVLRLLPLERRNPAIAVAGALLLLLPFDYLLRSFTFHYFYPQVVSETFAVAMLWALIAWHQKPAPSILPFFSLSGIAVLLTWPLWLPGPLISLVVLVGTQRYVSFLNKARQLAYTLIPITIIGVIYTLGHIRATQVLSAEGEVFAPSVTVYGRPFLVLALVGLVACMRKSQALPLLLFTGALLLQMSVMFIFSAYLHITDYYQAKMFFLLIYPMALLGALGIFALWHLPERFLRPVWRQRWPTFAIVLPVLVLAVAVRRDLPSHRFSAITEPVYQAGLWAKAHLPSGCIDYPVDHWITAYWLHVDVLGNPRASERTNFIIAGMEARRDSPLRWTDPGGLPFAIVSDLQAVPIEVRAGTGFKVLYEASSSAVVQRSDATTCNNEEVPLDRVVIGSR
jgi:hypothetical protein